jgi:hypothetical protein
MTASQRRLVLGGIFAAAALAAGTAYYLSLVPATHPDHDHGIMNLDAGGRLVVTQRNGEKRNLVGAPGHTLVVHYFSTDVPGAATELAGLFAAQKRLPKDVEFVVIAREPDFGKLDAWLKTNGLEPPVPDSLVLDPDGDTTSKMNAKRPIETMFFNAEGKLASQSRGPTSWDSVESELQKARGGTTIE